VIDPDRGTGRTTRQMVAAPQGAVFISARFAAGHDKQLALKHGRSDLVVVARHWLTERRWEGRLFTGIVVDHDARLTEKEQILLEAALTRVRN
jgi:hypothetical protein